MMQSTLSRVATRLILFAGLSAALCAFTETAASAQPYYGRGYGPPPGRYSGGWYGGNQHDGFYMRLLVGGGYLSATESDRVNTHEYSGIGATVGAAMGGAIAPNLILYGELIGTSIMDADYTFDGHPSGLSGLDLFQYGFGPGIAYYFQPINLYLSGTVTFTRVSFSRTGSDYYYDYYSTQDTNLGLGGSFMVGKEWWVGHRWAIGLAGQLQFASMGDPHVDARLRTTVGSFLFSLSYD